MISPSVPYLSLQQDERGTPLSATFIAFFKLDSLRIDSLPSPTVQIVLPPEQFIPNPLDQIAPYRMVRVTFTGGRIGRLCPSFSDLEVVREQDYDWSALPTRLLPDETTTQNLARRQALWLSTGLSPDPRMYEVRQSLWFDELGLSSRGLKHYLLLGHDEYVEVVAEDWKWEPGQPTA